MGCHFLNYVPNSCNIYLARRVSLWLALVRQAAIWRGSCGKKLRSPAANINSPKPLPSPGGNFHSDGRLRSRQEVAFWASATQPHWGQVSGIRTRAGPASAVATGGERAWVGARPRPSTPGRRNHLQLAVTASPTARPTYSSKQAPKVCRATPVLFICGESGADYSIKSWTGEPSGVPAPVLG